MAPSPRDLTTVDLRGPKPLLARQAATSGRTLSSVVRELLANAIQGMPAPLKAPQQEKGDRASERVRVCMRLSADQAGALLSASRASELRLGDYIAGLQAEVPAVQGGASLPDHLRQLAESTTELATLSRSLRHLTQLVQEGSFTAAGEYASVIAPLDDDVREHLRLASKTMLDLLPKARTAGSRASRHPSRE